MTTAPDTRYAVTAEGLHIAYQVAGSGPHDVVVMQPYHSVDAIWDQPQTAAAYRRLADVGRLILLDPRGFGASDPVPLGALPTPESWMEDTHAVLDAVGSARATLVSIGAPAFIPLLFAASYPQRTAGIVIVDGSARLIEDGDYPGLPPGLLKALAAWSESVQGTGAALAAFAAPSRRDDAAFLRSAGRIERLALSPSASGALIRWLGGVDVRAVLSAVRVPTLVVCHPDSPAGLAEHSRYLARNVAGAESKDLDGVDISFFTETADALVDAIEEFMTGVPPASDAGRVLATVLFADIVGSTDRAVSMGDRRWTALLGQHDNRVRAIIERFRGRLVKTDGDGTVATFDGPARAIHCAEAIRDAAGELELQVRCGLHTGEIELYGDDIAGIAVHIAARVQAVADANEIVVSRTVTDLVTGSGIKFDDRGEHELKGLPGTWNLFAVAD